MLDGKYSEIMFGNVRLFSLVMLFIYFFSTFMLLIDWIIFLKKKNIAGSTIQPAAVSEVSSVCEVFEVPEVPEVSEVSEFPEVSEVPDS